MDLNNFIESLTPAVIVASVSIALIALVRWWTSNPPIRDVTDELRRLRQVLDDKETASPQAIRDATDNSSNSVIVSLFKETQSGFLDLVDDTGVRTYSLRPYQSIWTARALLAKRVNIALYEAMPNILIGVGLLFTFLFLALALADVIPALRDGADPELIRSSISDLLKNASGKFLTSITGMTCSLLWTYFSKQNVEALESEIDSLCNAMQRHVAPIGAEAAIATQMAIFSEILTVNREQVGQLKRFETDFAVAIGKALGSQMQPAFEQLTSSITNALNALTEKVGSMNEDALGKMLKDFQDAIREHSGKEMAAFKESLVEIAKQIKEAAEKLEGAGIKVVGDLETGGKGITDALSGSAGDLKLAASLLEQAMITAKATVNDMDETLERAAQEGRSGLERVQGTLNKLSSVVDEITTLVQALQTTSTSFKNIADATTDATSNLQKIVSTQSTIVDSVTDVASTLNSSLTTANQEFRENAQTMAQTTSEMASGVENYSKRVAELHSKLDEDMAKAIGSLNGAVAELVEGLDDFLEEIGKARK